MPARKPHLFLDEVVVVEQPLARGGDADLVAHHPRQEGAGVLQQGGVLAQPRQQPLGHAAGVDAMGLGQAPPMQFHLLGAEELRTQWRLFRGSGRSRC